MKPNGSDSPWTDEALAELRREYGDFFTGRTCLVTGADGFMGSHLTEALVALDANVHAFVRAPSSGALNNIGHVRRQLAVHFADLTDKTSIDYLIKDLRDVEDRPYVFHLGAQAHVGESWHRPYETMMANTLGTLNLLQSIVDNGLELEKFDTAGTSEEYGNVREAVAHQHDFDDAGGLILHERSPINPKSIYATAKVAADFLTMNYHDAFALPGVVTRMFNNYGPRQNPRYVTGTIITQALAREQVELGALEPLRDFCFCTDGVRGHLTVAAHGIPGDVYVYGQGRVSRVAPRRSARAGRPRRPRRAQGRLRPDPRRGRGADVSRGRRGARLPPRRRGRRDRREPREPRPLLVREPPDGPERARAGAAQRDAEARRPRHRVRLPEADAGAVPRGRPLERLSRGDERAVRDREEVAPSGRAGLPRAVRPPLDLRPAHEPVRPARQLRPRDVARHPGPDPEDAGVDRRGRAVGRRLADPGVPVRRGRGRGSRPRRRALRRPRAGEPRNRR